MLKHYGSLKQYKYLIKIRASHSHSFSTVMEGRDLLSGFELFSGVMEKVLNDNLVDSFDMAQYFWKQFTTGFRWRLALVTAECHQLVDPDMAMALLSPVLHLQYWPPFSATFFKYILEKTTDDFRNSWTDTEENDITKLAELFVRNCEVLASRNRDAEK